MNIRHDFEALHPPIKIKVCRCEKCHNSKNKQKNRKYKKKVKRYLNRKWRNICHDGTMEVFYWA